MRPLMVAPPAVGSVGVEPPQAAETMRSVVATASAVLMNILNPVTSRAVSSEQTLFQR
jgi:hypothetical protein